MESIKKPLREYSIYQERKTTINHAFASAIAPVDQYNQATISESIRLLEQDPNGELTCAYCSQPAETWDHLESLVEHGHFRGYGDIIGNLVPCCKSCHSAKGAKSESCVVYERGIAWAKHRRGVAGEGLFTTEDTEGSRSSPSLTIAIITATTEAR
ncbi:HNH endonuclease [Chloroflexus sp.]|uniref:HNH endonuclease n=1 Tax=Chloroflexus sp. TaxID=1904827 RepID=UPI003A0FCF20